MARSAVLSALALLLCARAASAQDTARVAHPDRGGYIARLQATRFHQALLEVVPDRPAMAPWELGSGASRAGSVVAQFDSALARERADRDAEAIHEHLLARLNGRGIALDTVTAGTRGLFGLSSNTADVTFNGSLQLQVGTTRNRNLACTPAQVQDPSSGCGGGFKSPTIDNTVSLAARGVFAQRFHVNVDFDSKRDYAANNIISAWYQGLEDEKLQQVNIGTVIWTPPPSRFFTASVPTNNFGVSAVMAFGPVTLRGIFATQKGSVVADKTFTIGTNVVSPQDNTVRDLDYESERFFWVVNPRALTGYPALDILSAGAIPVSSAVQPADVRIYRYVAANAGAGASSNYNGITALAANGSERTGALRWLLLQPNVDYWLDPSGLWFVLRSKISPTDYLAVSYRTRSGALVGSLPTTDNPAAKDSLRLIYEPNQGAVSPVFPYEMRQVYRAAGASLVPSSLQAQVLVAGSERPDSALGTYLSLLGLSTAADQGSFDTYNRLFPRARDPGASQVIQDALIVFPSVTPFSDPGLTSRERNDSLYVTPEYLLLSQGPPSKFQLHLKFNAQSGADRSTLSLDALQIAPSSEKITVNGMPLTRSKDYTIDYTSGRVTFLDPNDLFGSGAATVHVSFEQLQLFAQAPTTIVGLSAIWNLGINKSVTMSGLYQAQSTTFTTPQIGFEPQASTLLGMTGDFLWDTRGITRWLNHLVTKSTTAPSSVRLSGEVALSRPDPNRSGAAYLVDFEDDHSIRLSAVETQWVPGSMPKSGAALTDVLGPQGFDSAGAVRMIWQNLVPNGRDSITQLSPHDIDPTITLTQSNTPTIEPVLWVTLHGDTAGGIGDTIGRSRWTQSSRHLPRFASMTQAISPTGTDLTNNDYFEFAMYQASANTVQHTQTRIVIDLGKVSEDALAIAPLSFHLATAAEAAQTGFNVGDTIYTGRQYTGVGTLQSEKTFFGTWSAVTDDSGILGDRPDSLIGPGGVIVRSPSLCADTLGATTILYRWGDLRARCSRGNGFPDTEDLDGDNVLDAQGPADNVFRYVINLATDSAKYFVRSHTITDAAGRSATWTIYRVPLRAPDDTIGNPDMHLIRQLRMTMVAPADPATPGQPVFFALALMKFTGATWVTRAPRPIVSISGPVAAYNGSVVVGSVSTQDGDSLGHGYQPPPGIGNAAATLAVSASQYSQQINEKSLSITAYGLQPGERAEAYSRVTSGSINLLAYQQLRVWVKGAQRLNAAGQNAPPAAGWDNGQLQAYVKVGSDAYNFYVYRAGANTTSWNPEMVIDLSVWKSLKQQVEDERLSLEPPGASDWRRCGGDSTAYVACTADLAYMVQVHDPLVNPPNLAAVQELAAGIYYPTGGSTATIDSTELWVDDIRVGLPVSTTGVVAAVNARVVFSDVGTIDLAGAYQNGNFQALGVAPSYQNTTSFSAGTTMHIEKFLPTRFGLLVPMSVSTSFGWVDPQLLSGTDVQTAGLVGLRRPRNDATTWTISILHPARETVGRAGPFTRLVLNALSFNASGSVGSTTTSLSDASSSTWSTSLNYFLNTERRLHPIHLAGLVRGLPRWLRESEAGRGVASAAVSPWPTGLQFSSSLSHTMGDLQAYQVPIQVLADTILKPVTSEQYLWRNSANVTWIPVTMLTVTSGWISTRDLREYPDSTSIGRIANASHLSFFGTDVGVERDRSFVNSVAFGPHIASWLAPSVSVASAFILSRALTGRNPVRIDGDTAGAYILPQTLNNSRMITYNLSVDPHKLAQRIFGDSSRIARELTDFRAIQFTRIRTYESTFDLATFDPGLGYQLALGGFNSFLNQRGQEALGAVNATSSGVTVSATLRAGLSAQLTYRSTNSDRYQHQAGPTGFLETTGSTTTWPSGRFSWGKTFRNGPLTQISAGATIQHDAATSSSPLGDGTSSIASSVTQRFTPDLMLVFRNAVSLRTSGEVDRGSSSYGGNSTQTSTSNFSQNLAWQTRMPRFISSTRRNIMLNLTVTQSTTSSCIQRSADSGCVPYFDLRRLEVQSSVRALLQHGITAAVNAGYVHNDVRSLGQLTSTITLNATFSIPLTSLGM